MVSRTLDRKNIDRGNWEIFVGVQTVAFKVNKF